jgi:hypothetical protein
MSFTCPTLQDDALIDCTLPRFYLFASPAANPPTMPVQHQRCLWKRDEEKEKKKNKRLEEEEEDETFEAILERFSSRPAKKSLFVLTSNAVVVVQEFSLTCFLLFRHRLALLEEEELPYSAGRQWKVDLSTASMMCAFLLAVFYSARADQTHQLSRTVKARQRSADAALLAVLLRLLASLLQSLTASYSSDTVGQLAVAGMLVHLLACDYSYANGRLPPKLPLQQQSSPRPPFRGGTVSLNAALFSVTLLVSRLRSHTAAYLFVSHAVVLFAFYPATRHAIAHSYPPSHCGA